MRSGSAAIAKNGKIDVAPITWKTACTRASEKTPASFALPYGRARKRTRRRRSETLWTNRGMFPSYTFTKSGASAPRNGEISQLSAGKLRCQKLPDDCGRLRRRPSTLSAFAHGEFHSQAMTAIQSFIRIDVSPFTKASNRINAMFAEPMLGERYNVATRMRLNRISQRHSKHISTANVINRRDHAHSYQTRNNGIHQRFGVSAAAKRVEV